jgi:hypothetical protein
MLELGSVLKLPAGSEMKPPCWVGPLEASATGRLQLRAVAEGDVDGVAAGELVALGVA